MQAAPVLDGVAVTRPATEVARCGVGGPPPPQPFVAKSGEGTPAWTEAEPAKSYNIIT